MRVRVRVSVCVRVCAPSLSLSLHTHTHTEGRGRLEWAGRQRVEAEEECKAPSRAENWSICADSLRCLQQTDTQRFKPGKFVVVVLVVGVFFRLACKVSARRSSATNQPTAAYRTQHQGFNHGDQSVHSIVLRIHFGKR